MRKLTKVLPTTTPRMPKRTTSLYEATAACMQSRHYLHGQIHCLCPLYASPLHGFVTIEMGSTAEFRLRITFGNRLPSGDEAAAFLREFMPRVLRYWLQAHFAFAYLRSMQLDHPKLGWSTGEIIGAQHAVACLSPSIATEAAARKAGHRAAGKRSASASQNTEEE